MIVRFDLERVVCPMVLKLGSSSLVMRGVDVSDQRLVPSDNESTARNEYLNVWRTCVKHLSQLNKLKETTEGEVLHKCHFSRYSQHQRERAPLQQNVRNDAIGALQCQQMKQILDHMILEEEDLCVSFAELHVRNIYKQAGAVLG